MRIHHLLRLTLLFLLVSVPLSAQMQITYPGKSNPHSQGNRLEWDCTECHSTAAINTQIHALYNLNINDPRISIPKDFPLAKDSVMNCFTCHLVAEKQDRINRTFLRGGPYPTELEFCYNCHSEKDYAGVNPHSQLREDGSVNSGVCLHCHTNQPSSTDHPSIVADMRLEMKATCNKCHALHTHEQNHYGKSLVGSKVATLKQYTATEEQYKIKLPLSTDKQIQCHTCHYIHGTLGIDAVIYNSSEENQHFLRLPQERLCYACHNL
ncbi:hypothetical protein HQ531_05550 [bacterium]|nr:hypothetical protein [bacterium]